MGGSASHPLFGEGMGEGIALVKMKYKGMDTGIPVAMVMIWESGMELTI